MHKIALNSNRTAPLGISIGLLPPSVRWILLVPTQWTYAPRSLQESNMNKDCAWCEFWASEPLQPKGGKGSASQGTPCGSSSPAGKIPGKEGISTSQKFPPQLGRRLRMSWIPCSWGLSVEGDGSLHVASFMKTWPTRLSIKGESGIVKHLWTFSSGMAIKHPVCLGYCFLEMEHTVTPVGLYSLLLHAGGLCYHSLQGEATGFLKRFQGSQWRYSWKRLLYNHNILCYLQARAESLVYTCSRTKWEQNCKMNFTISDCHWRMVL